MPPHPLRPPRTLLTVVACALLAGAGYAQPASAERATKRRTARAAAPIATAEAVAEPLRIDGALDEGHALTLGGFRQYAPDPLAPATYATEVWVGYDDAALYVQARLLDPHPDSILRQLSERDRLRNTDWFAVSVNPYRDGINATNFVVTPAGVQYDSKFGTDDGGSSQVMQSGDVSWDGVWTSGTALTEDGWVAELRIPYSMLRFPETEIQTWDINFARQIRRFREESFWSPVDPAGADATTQMGKLVGIRGIRPPLRLQATPFATAGVTQRTTPGDPAPDEWGATFGGGMDVKYGLSDAFTLDMTLVPDFSNARSDDQVLNLGANEIRFDENRAFFTEGVELFNKGGFFYSRRIGAAPINLDRLDDLADGETAVEVPTSARLLNATKVSGRTEGGLGIGVFNAVEGATRVDVRGPGGALREVEVAPLTNYSVVALDQNLPHNSFVSLVNTTVWRAGRTYDANLTGVAFDLRDSANVWSANGSAAVSQQYGLPTPAGREDAFGHTANVEVERISGRLRYGLEYTEESDDYDPNDLGFLFFNNSRTVEGYGQYNWFEPTGPFNSASVQAFAGYLRLYEPARYVGSYIGANSRLTTRGFFTFGGGGFTELTDWYEFQDTRTPGVALAIPQYFQLDAFISSDYRKAFALDVFAEYGDFHRDAEFDRVAVRVRPRLRVSDKLSAQLDTRLSRGRGALGYVGHSARGAAAYGLEGLGTGVRALDPGAVGYDALADEAIVMSRRDLDEAQFELSVDYSFTANLTLDLRVRHYWSEVEHTRFFEIDRAEVARPTPYSGRAADGARVHDQSFNAFNVDGFVRWRFAPGSDAFLSYKTQSFFDGPLRRGYGENLRGLGGAPINNSLTLKVVYWLDVGRLKG